MNSVFILLDNSNPATLFPGTTWQKQEGRFLQGTSGSESAGGTGGASTVTLTTSHLPAHNHTGSVTIASAGEHRHQVDNHTHTQPTHVHKDNRGVTPTSGSGWSRDSNYNTSGASENTSSSGGDNTGGSAPNTNTTGSHGHNATLSISNAGSGNSFSIIPPYLRVNIWKRLT
ncbi:MAG: phage baseplate protein [Cetobacterium sp.]